MRIAIIADTYPPMRTSGAVQLRDLARELVRLGHRPCVITPASGIERGWQRESVDGVDVFRANTLRTKDVNYAYRAMAEFLLPFALAIKLRRSDLASEQWDGVVWYSPNIFFGPLVWLLRRRCKCRSYLILRDIFPEWAVDAGILKRGLIYRWFKLVERFQYSVADVIGVQSPSNLSYLDDWSKKPDRKLEVLNNWLSDYSPGSCDTQSPIQGLEGKTVFVYVGNMGVAQGMDCLIGLAEKLNDSPDILFLFVGRGSEVARLQAACLERQISNVRFSGEIEPDEVGPLLRRCHVGMLALDPRHKTHNIPGKFLAYLFAGIPILARVNSGNDLETLISDRSVGSVTNGDDPVEHLYDQAIKLAGDAEIRRQMSSNCRNLANEMFSSISAATQILTALSHDAAGQK